MIWEENKAVRNIPYNSLPGLPPAETLYKDTAVIQKLAEASRKLAELKGVASMLPNQSIFVNTISLREAKASSAIENIFTTDDELYRALTYQEEDYVQGPAKEILHYREALWKGYNEIVKARKFTVDAIVEIYRQVKQTHDGIRPYQAEIVNDFVEFLNDDERFPVDPLMKMAMAHYQFEAIHPFRDGNGRTGRIICLLYLIQKGLLDLPILYMSAYILQNKDKYYYDLSNVTGTQNWKEWLLFMMETVIQTSEYTIYMINRIRSLISKTEDIIKERKPAVAKIEIPKLFEQPYIRPKNLVSEKIKSVNTAKKYLTDLEALGLLTKTKIGKEFVWFNTELMDILSAEN